MISTMCGEDGQPIFVSEEDVLRVLKKTNPKKAAGFDSLRPKVLKLCADQLSPVLCYIIKLSLAQCKAPQ